jgi:hypothetical protein
MSNRLGTPSELTAAAAAVGGSFTRSVTVIGQQWQALISVFATWVASGTAGNRQLSLQIKDAAGNVLWQSIQGTNVTAGQTVNILAGGGSAPAAVTGPPITQTLPLPVDMPLPVGATVSIIDGASISATDTCLINAVVTA